jgi:Ca2+-binding RTX toxin-like protein
MNALVQAVLTNLHSAGQMTDEWYVTLRKYDWGAIAQSDAFALPAAAGYGISLLGAMLSDAVGFQVDRHVQLFNTIREWVSGAVQTVDASISSEDRRVQAEMMLALVPGAAIGSKLAPILQPLALDINQFAQTLTTTGSNWLHEALVVVRDRGNALGHNVATLSAALASAVVDAARAIEASQTTVQNYLDAVLVPFVRDTAHGIGNAVLDFLQDVPGTLFDLGRTLSFTELNPFTNAYAAALDDRTIASDLRTALEDAQSIVQQAGQTVVVQPGIGANPFNGAGFNPDTIPPAAVNVNEGQVRTISINLPFEAGTGGQRLQLTLAGPNAGTFTVLTGSGTLTPQNGAVLLTIPDGQRQLVVGLRSTQDVSVNSSLTVSATLLDAAGTPTHTTHLEANVALADTGDLASSALPVQGPVEATIQGTPLSDFLHHEGFLINDLMSGGLGSDWFEPWFGDDRVFGEGGHDLLRGGTGRDLLDGGDGVDRLEGDANQFGDVQGIPDQDYLDGGAGDDTLLGEEQDDVLLGSEGADQLLGDDYVPPPGQPITRPVGQDYLDGGAGHDELFGGLGEDVLVGSDGDDTLQGDNVSAGGWYEFVSDATFFIVPVFTPTGRPARFTADGYADYLDGGAGSDILIGDGGDDVLLGGSENDFLFGDDQSTFTVTPGADWLEGGAGDDRLICAGNVVLTS